MTVADNKRIAKNTIYLYIRTFVSMAIALYTSRIVLDTLGVEDFGIFGVVGGVMALFAVLSNSMSVATQRFLTFELGKKGNGEFQKVFSMVCIIHALIGLIFIFLSETVGLWFVNTYLNIPSDRMTAANIVYQISVISTAISILQIPYNSAVVSYERMHVYAYVGLGESVAKLLIVFLLITSPIDKLVMYAILLLGLKIIGCTVYRLYCIRKLPGCHIKIIWDKDLFKAIAEFTGWNLFGSVAGTAKTQSTNIYINIFGGPAFNATMGVAGQVSVAINSLVSGFQSAANPQLTKNYAAGDSEATCRLLYKSSKISFLLMLIVSLPVFFEIDYILNLWLVDVPPLAVLFTRLIIVECLFDTLAGPMTTSLLATGHIKWYQIAIGSIHLLNIPITYFFLMEGCYIATPLVVSIVLVMLSNVSRLFFCRNMLGLSLKTYLGEVVVPICMVCLLSVIPVVMVVPVMEPSFFRLILTVFVSVTTVVVFAYSIGLNHSERQFILNIIRPRLYQILRIRN